MEPPSFTLPREGARDVVAALAEALPGARLGEPARGRRVTIDTFDGRLRQAGIRLEHVAAGAVRLLRVWSGRGARVPVEVPLDAPPPALARDFPAGAVWRRLAKAAGVRALLPLAEESGSVRSGECRDRRGKTVLRLEAWWPAGGRAGRLDLLPVRGYPQAVQRAVDALDGLGLARAEPAGATGVAAGRPPAPALDAAQPAGESCRRLLARELAVMVENEPGMRDDLDPEFLHDFRVALRRTRTVLGECAAVVPSRQGRRFRAGLRWLGSVTGPVRDADVHLIDLDAMRASLPPRLRGDLDVLAAHLRADRRRRHARLVGTLRTRRYRSLLGDWSAFLEDVSRWGVTAAARAPVAGLAAERIRRCAHRVRRAGRAIDADSPDEALHELRKRCKRLRYLIELFGPLYRPADVRAFVRSLKKLQENLGEHQDMAVRTATLKGFLDTAAGIGPGARAATEILLAAADARRGAAHDAFQERFAAFDTKRVRERLGAMLGRAGR